MTPIRSQRKAPLWSLFALWLFAGAATASTPPTAAVVSAHPLASEAGRLVLEAGGNAFDAAVAVSAALAVVEPYASGLGGGGLWLLQRGGDGGAVMVDGRERAPLAAHADMFLAADGRPVPRASIDGALAAGIPGEPAALAHIARRYGRLPLAVSLAPAVILARDGFPVDAVYRRMATMRLDALRADPAAARQFLLDDQVPPLGHRLRQPELAATLEAIAVHGEPGFYSGPVAAAMVEAVRAGGGIWRQADLDGYRVVERRPVETHYRGWRVLSAALPSSGGVLLAQMLPMLEIRPLDGLGAVDRVHLLVEVMRLAYADRARHLGDPDQVAVPLGRLLSPDYLRGRAATIDMAHAAISAPQADPQGEGADTTHLAVLDGEGNRVAATLSVNYPFGSGVVAPGTGVLLNDEMDDFSIKPGVANAYGLVGSQANAIAPGKRMLSSMSPTIVEDAGRVVILGTPGGSRIISMVLLGLLQAVDGADATRIVAAGRFHHQYLPDRIEVEPEALPGAVIDGLRARGHAVEVLAHDYGNMQVIVWERAQGRVEVASDPRGIGAGYLLPVR